MPGDELVRRAQTGDVRALEQLCNREWRPVYAIVYATTRNPSDAEDLTQEVFLRALKARERSEPSIKERELATGPRRNLIPDDLARLELRDEHFGVVFEL